MRSRWILVGLGLLVLGLIAVFAAGLSSGAREREVAKPSTGTGNTSRSTTTASRDRSPPAPLPSTTPTRSADADRQAERVRVRENILAAQRAREAAHGEAQVAAEPEPDEHDEGPAPAGLENRTGEHQTLVAELNRDFLPLADECIEAARERLPELAGLLALEFELVVDEQLGAVVETVDFPPLDERGDPHVDDPALRECLRESLLSMLLPAGSADGREALMISLALDGEE